MGNAVSLGRRVEALEQRTGSDERPWHRIIADGQTDEEAIAAYEADHGPIGDDNVLIWQIVDPA